MSTPGKARPMTVPAFAKRKGGDEPLTVLTAYDRPTTLTAEAAGVDALLVGDSLGNVLLGHDSTLPVTLEEITHHARAVGRVRERALLIVDMPAFSYHVSPEESVRNAATIVRASGADAVKLEGGAKRVPMIRAILDAEVPVMGHLGLTPQSVLTMGGYRVQGKSDAAAEALVADAKALTEAGVFAIVLEGIPGPVAERITREVAVPTIGIGAGPHCDGQVLVYHDMLGMTPDRPPKFVRQYDSLYGRQVEAIERWVADVRQGSFPGDAETY